MGTIKRDIELNQLFPVPPNVIDVRQEFSETTTSTFDEADAATTTETSTQTSDVDFLNPTVTSMTISDQDIRFTPDGRAVVDVTAVFAVSDDIIDLEVQITKT